MDQTVNAPSSTAASRSCNQATGYSSRQVSRQLSDKVAATPQAIAKLQTAINAIEKEKKETAEIISRARQAIRKTSLRKFAAQAEIDPANLYNTITGKRRPSAEMLAKLQQILMKMDD